MIQRYSALLAALFASLMLSQTPAHADGLEDVLKRGVLKVAVPQDFPPFGSVGPDMKPRGLDIDTPRGAALFLALVRDLGGERGVVLDHTNSGVIRGRPEEPCTSYATMLFSR